VKPWVRQIGAFLLTAALVYPAIAQGQSHSTQQQSQQQGQQQSPPPSQQQTQQTEPQSQQQQPPPDAVPDSGQTQQADVPSEPGAKPGVKGGSEADVNAIGNRKVGHGPDFYSMEHEIALGKQLAQEVDRVSKFITDPVVTEYVNRVGQNLVRNSDAQVPFSIKVIDSDVVNAFALPGGFFYVNSGIILRADEESEMAGVMAHEIAHVCARHGTRNATKANIMQMATIPLILLGPGGWAGYGLYEGLNFLIPVTYLKFNRDAEREADYLGLQYMYKAGYDPNSFVTFFEKVEADEKKHPGTIPKIFSTHPPTPDRIEATQKEIAVLLPSRDEYIVTTSEFDVVKRRLAAIESGQKVTEKKSAKEKPTLRKKTEQTPPTTTGTGTGTGSTTDNTGDQNPDDDRPVLKRRPD
jgi:beta-barrel assembly-enhancing protease